MRHTATPIRVLRGLPALLLTTLPLPSPSTAPVSPPTDMAALPATLTGRVIDAATSTPLAGARVVVEGTALAATTDPQGRFTLRQVPLGEQLLFVQRAGYRDARHPVTVVADRTQVVEIALIQSALPLDAPVVHERSAAQPRIAGSVARIPAVAHMRRIDFNTESYAHIDENDFRRVDVAPLSTFAIDVDRASYANIRRFIQRGERPPIDAVRIEEMINYFPYEQRGIAGAHPFAVTTEVWQAPWKREHRLVRIGLHAEAIAAAELPPGNLVFLLDVSGSMSAPAKLPLLKRALALLVDQLRAEDRLAIVVYAGAAGLVLPSTPGDRKAEIIAALDDLAAGGSTAGGAGIRLAYDVARKNFIEDGNNRIILATDGDFNVGASSDAEMVRLIEEERQSGVFLTVLGFGTGNLRDSKMEQIADHGNGNFHYVDGLLEARKVLVEEMGGTLLTLARDVKIQVEFNPARAAAYRLIGYENRLLNDEDFNDDTEDAGDLGAGHAVTALYEVVPVGEEVPGVAVDDLRYQGARNDSTDPAGAQSGAFDDELLLVKVRYSDPGDMQGASTLLEHPAVDRIRAPSDDFRFAAAVAGFGMLLRNSEYAGLLTLDDVVELARRGRGPDPRGYRGEFIRLVETTRDLGLLRGGNLNQELNQD